MRIELGEVGVVLRHLREVVVAEGVVRRELAVGELLLDLHKGLQVGLITRVGRRDFHGVGGMAREERCGGHLSKKHRSPRSELPKYNVVHQPGNSRERISRGYV